MSLVIKAKIQKKNNNSRIIETFIEILKDRGNKQLLVDFKDKYNAWSRGFSDGWNLCETAKSDSFEALKPSPFIRTIMTAIIFFSVLEYFRTTNILFLALAFSIIAFFAIFVKSVIMVSYFAAPWKYLTYVQEYFKAVYTMSTRFSRRLNILQRTLKLNFNRHDLHLNNGHIADKESLWNLLLSAFFVFNVYGVLLAVITFAICFYTTYDSFLLSEALVIYFLIIVAIRNDVINVASFRNIKRIQKQMVNITEDFKIWFQNDCELKHILQELKFDDDKLFLFPSKNFKLFKEAPYLNFTLFLVMFENTLRRYLNTNKADEFFLFLLSGNKKFSKVVIKKDVNISVRESLLISPDNLNEKENLPIHNQNLSGEVCSVRMEKKKNKSKNKACMLTSEDNSCINPIDVKDYGHANISKENSCKKAIKSRIPKLVTGEKYSYIAKDKTPEALKFDENLQFRPELTPKNLTQNIYEDLSTPGSENISVRMNLKLSEDKLNIWCNGEHTENCGNDPELINDKSNELNGTTPTEGAHSSEPFKHASLNFNCHFDNSNTKDEIGMDTESGKDILTMQRNENFAENSCTGMMHSTLNNEIDENSESANKICDSTCQSLFDRLCLNDPEICELLKKLRNNVAICNSFDTTPESQSFEIGSNKFESSQKVDLLDKLHDDAETAGIENPPDTADCTNDSTAGDHESVKNIPDDYQKCRISEFMESANDYVSTDVYENDIAHRNLHAAEVIRNSERILDYALDGNSLDSGPQSVLFESSTNELESSGEKNGESQYLTSNLQEIKMINYEDDDSDFVTTADESDTSSAVGATVVIEGSNSNDHPLTSDYGGSVSNGQQNVNINETTNAETLSMSPRNVENNSSCNQLHRCSNYTGANPYDLFSSPETTYRDSSSNFLLVPQSPDRLVRNVNFDDRCVTETCTEPEDKDFDKEAIFDGQNCVYGNRREAEGKTQYFQENEILSLKKTGDVFQFGSVGKSPNLGLKTDSKGDGNVDIQDNFDGHNSGYGNCLLTGGKTQHFGGNELFSVTETGNVFHFGNIKESPSHGCKMNLKDDGKYNLAFDVQSSENSMSLNNSKNLVQTPVFENMDFESMRESENMQKTEDTLEDKLQRVESKIIPNSPSELIEPEKNDTDANKADSSQMPNFLQTRKILKSKRKIRNFLDLKNVQENVEGLLRALKLENGDVSNPDEFMALNEAEAYIEQRMPLETEPIDSLNMPSDLNCNESENRTLLHTLLDSSDKTSQRYLLETPTLLTDKSSSFGDDKTSQRYLLETPTLLTDKSSSFGDAKCNATNMPLNGIAVSPCASATSDDNAFQISDKYRLKSPQNTFTLNEYNTKKLFSIGECSSPGTQNHSSETETPNIDNDIKEEYDESQASDPSTISRMTHLLQTHKTKDCMLAFVEKERKVIKGQINFARKTIKKKNHAYICESSSLEMLYSENEEICRKDEDDMNQMLQTGDCSINALKTYNGTPLASSAENLNNDPLEIPGEESGFTRNRRSSSSAYSRSSEEVPNSCSEFKDEEYRMIGSSEDENFHFHYSTTDTSSLSQGSIDTTQKQLQESAETDESNEESVVTTIDCYNPEEDVTNSVNDNEQKVEWQFKELQTSAKVQSEENYGSFPEKWKSVDYTDSQQECTSYGYKQDNVTMWKSNLEKFGEDGGDSPQMLNNSERERNDSFSDERQDAKPLRYNLKYENLDLTILDSAPCVTIKLICEKEVENPQPVRNQLRHARTPEHRLPSKYEIILTPEDSSVGSSSEVPYAEISKLNLTVTAGQEESRETLNSTPQPVLNKATLPQKDSQDSTFDEVNETCSKSATASGVEESGLKDDLNSNIKEADDPSGHPTDKSTIEDKETASEEKRELDTCVTESNLCNSDSNNQCVENMLETTADAISEYEKNDFNFETDNLQLNYKPTPHSGSIDVSFRKTRSCKKLVFKTEEKKLYVKMTPPH